MRRALQDEEKRRSEAITALSHQQLDALRASASRIAGTLEGLERPDQLTRVWGGEFTPLAELVRIGEPRVEASLHLPTKRGDPPPRFCLEGDGAGVARVFIPGNPPRPELAWVAWRRFRDAADHAFVVWVGRPLRGSGLDAFAAAAGGAWRAYPTAAEPGPPEADRVLASGGQLPAQPRVSLSIRLPRVDGADLRLELIVPASPWPELKARLLEGQLSTSALALLLGLLVAALVGRSIARPVTALTRAARRVASGDLEQAVEASGRDEVGQLARAFNEMTLRLRAAQRRLRRTERIEAWREAAQRVAHEVKNPLFPIRLAAETVQKAVRRGHPELEQLVDRSTETILAEVKSVDRLVAEFSDFARLPAARICKSSVRLVLERVEAFDDRVTVIQSEDVDVDVEMDPDLITRALFNLVKNGLEASTEVRTGYDAERACFWVEDEGPGIPPGIREELFEPYVSRKPGGTGLGLAVVERICLAHDAEIAVYSPRDSWAEPPGARFEIQLPAPPARRPREHVSESA